MTVESNSVLRMYYWMNNENKYRVGLGINRDIEKQWVREILTWEFYFPMSHKSSESHLQGKKIDCGITSTGIAFSKCSVLAGVWPK